MIKVLNYLPTINFDMNNLTNMLETVVNNQNSLALSIEVLAVLNVYSQVYIEMGINSDHISINIPDYQFYYNVSSKWDIENLMVALNKTNILVDLDIKDVCK